MKTGGIWALQVIVSLLLACRTVSPTQEVAPTVSSSQLANPASVYCEEQGGKIDIHANSNGEQVGFCIFPNGSECEEWAFYHRVCTPGEVGTAEALEIEPVLTTKTASSTLDQALFAELRPIYQIFSESGEDI